MFIDPDERPQPRSTSDLGRCATAENNEGSCTPLALHVLFTLMTTTQPAPVDELLFGKRAGEIIAKSATVPRT
jgi:hypothetical protein